MYKIINLHVTPEMHRYLKEAAFAESTPGNIVSVTKYLQNLIKEDMKKKEEKR